MNRSLIKILTASVAGVFAFWTIFLLVHANISWQIDSIGTFGDSYGVLNALFAAGAFIAVLISLKSQGDELHRQRFEASYFQLLELLRELRKQAETANPNLVGTRLKGVEAIAKIYDQMQTMAKQIPPQRNVEKATWADWYDQVCQFAGGNSLGPYFRVMYSMLQRVSDDKILTSAEKVRYGNLLRGQLSTHEIGLVGWNGLTDGSKDFSRFIEEFRLLKYLHEPNLKEVFQEFYEKSAFEGRAD